MSAMSSGLLPGQGAYVRCCEQPTGESGPPVGGRAANCAAEKLAVTNDSAVAIDVSFAWSTVAGKAVPGVGYREVVDRVGTIRAGWIDVDLERVKSSRTARSMGTGI